MKKYTLFFGAFFTTYMLHSATVNDITVVGKVITNEMQVSTVGKVASIWLIDGSSQNVAGISSMTILDEGVLLAGATSLQFVGAGVSVSVVNGTGVVVINGGGGGGEDSFYNPIATGPAKTPFGTEGSSATYTSSVTAYGGFVSSVGYTGGGSTFTSVNVSNYFALNVAPLSFFHANMGAQRAIFQINNASILSPVNIWNTNTGLSAGAGMLFSAGGNGTSTGFVGGMASQRLDASTSRTVIRAISAGSLSLTDTGSPIFLEGTANGFKVVVTTAFAVGGTNVAGLFHISNGSATIDSGNGAGGGISAATYTVRGVPIISSTWSFIAHEGFAMAVATGSIAPNTTLTFTASQFQFSALGIPVCGNMKGAAAPTLPIYLEDASITATQFQITNPDLTNIQKFSCHVPGRPQ